MRIGMGRFNGKACPLGLSNDFDINETLPSRVSEKIELVAADGRTRRLGQQALLLVARMHPDEREKGHRELLNILPDLLHRHPDVQLVFAGPGEDRSNIEALAAQSGMAQAVFLPGRVSDDQLQFLYRHCYAYVMPSRQEGFGLVHLEAMNYGKPCLGCRNDGAADVIVHEKTGLLVDDPTDKGELVGAVLRLLDNPAQAQQWGRNGFERLHKLFTAEHHQQRLKTHFRSFLGYK